MNNGNRPRSGLGAEFTLWVQAVTGSVCDLWRRRELRRLRATAGAAPPAADPKVHVRFDPPEPPTPWTGGVGVISPGRPTAGGRRTPMIVAALTGVAVSSWAVVNAISSPAAHGPKAPGTDPARSPVSSTQQSRPVESSPPATTPGAVVVPQATSGVLPPAPVLPTAATSTGPDTSTSQSTPTRDDASAHYGTEPMIPNDAPAIAAGERPDHVPTMGTAAAAEQHPDSGDSHNPASAVTAVPGSKRPVAPATAVPGSKRPVAPATAVPGSKRPVAPATAVPGSKRPVSPATAVPGSKRPVSEEVCRVCDDGDDEGGCCDQPGCPDDHRSSADCGHAAGDAGRAQPGDGAG
jgi:hypothetical protein